MAKPANGNGARFRVQSLALFVALSAPFGIYWALQSGLAALAGLFFGLLAASLALTMWKG
jgi:hypothetical protein